MTERGFQLYSLLNGKEFRFCQLFLGVDAECLAGRKRDGFDRLSVGASELDQVGDVILASSGILLYPRECSLQPLYVNTKNVWIKLFSLT